MAEITAAAVKALRDQTGAGMMDCKKVLKDAGGDLDKAVELLRERGLAKAGKREGRATSEGVIAIALDGAAGGMVELGCETDFVARTDECKALVKDIAMHVAASDPVAVARDDVSAELAATEREMMKAQAAEMGKPEAVREKIVEGRMEKWYGEKVLMEQPFVKDPDQKISDVVTATVAKLGENIQIRRFTRFVLGEEA